MYRSVKDELESRKSIEISQTGSRDLLADPMSGGFEADLAVSFVDVKDVTRAGLRARRR